MGPTDCPETSVANYRSTLRKQPSTANISFTPRRWYENTLRYTLLTRQFDVVESGEMLTEDTVLNGKLLIQ